MARIDIKSNGTGGGGGGGNLQLAGGASMDATLRAVTDTSNTASPLKLSTASVQVNSPLRITTSDASGFYLDAEDSATNNRFSIKRDPSSQEVTLDFASNPAGSTTLVGAIRTYGDGVNLSNAMSFREDGNVGIGTTTPNELLDVSKNQASPTRINITNTDAAGTSTLRFTNASGAAAALFENSSNQLTFQNNTNSGVLRFQTTNAGGTTLTAVTVTSDQDVGIGTTAPIGRLHLYKAAATTRMVMDGDAGQSKIITYRTAGLQRFGLYVNNTAESGSNAGSDFAIRAYNDAGTLLSTPVFIKRDTGNVGINTITGTAKLQVVGTGSTSATTSLLVQNSAGVASLQVLDDTSVFNNGKGAVASNTAFGNSALINNTTGGNNTAIGVSALINNTTGANNTANGRSALQNNTTGANNTANGESALFSNIGGSSNTANGVQALRNNTLGSSNTANGVSALQNNTLGSSNTAIGRESLRANTSGNDNTALGFQAGDNITTGAGNVCIGSGAEPLAATDSNQFVVGTAAINAGAVTAEANISTNVWNVIINGVARKILLA
jgi:hypothetical protein